MSGPRPRKNASQSPPSGLLDRMRPARGIFVQDSGDVSETAEFAKTIRTRHNAEVTRSEKKLHEYFDGISKLIAETPSLLPALKSFSRDMQIAYRPAEVADAASTYSSREDRDESAPDFIKRVYGHLLDGDFTRPELHRIDPSAEKALRDWEYRNHRLSPEELNLPTEEERNNRLIEQGLDNEPDALRRQALRYIQQKRRFNHGRR